MKLPGLEKPGLRGRLLLSVVGAIALVLVALTVAFNLVLDNRLDHDANNVVEARAIAELGELRVVNGRIALPEAADVGAVDSQIWVFDGRRLIERPRSDGGNARVVAALAGRGRLFVDVSATRTRLFAVPVVQGGRRVGTVVAGVSLRPYEQTRRTALISSAVLALLVLIAVGLATRWLISRALSPVARMTAQAAEWSDRDLDHRFALGEPHDELTQLAATLDGLLDRLAASLRHEQRFSAELSHELRTPLANVMAEAQFALRHAQGADEYRAGFEQVLQSARQMSRTLEALIVAARAEFDPGIATSDAATCARSAILGCESLAARHDVDVELVTQSVQMRVAVESDLVERMLAPLLENACRYAQQSVRVAIERDGASVLFVVEDDGPGVREEDREAIFEPGRQAKSRQSASVATQGAGLGLALALRLARSAGGDVEIGAGDGGARFVTRLPAV